jgi:soluble lytic murein transglycosylase
MKRGVLYIWLSLLIISGANAGDLAKEKSSHHVSQANSSDLAQKKLFHKISHSVDSNVQKEFLRIASCNPIALLQGNKLEESFICAKKLKHPQLIRATQWRYYSSDRNKASFEEIVSFINSNPYFPDKDVLMKLAENKINSQTNPRVLTKWCMNNIPHSGTAAKYCLENLSNQKLETSKEAGKLRSCIERCTKIAWMKHTLSISEERLFMDTYGKLLTDNDHINRLNYFLHKNQTLSPVVLEKLKKNYKELFELKLRLMRGSSGSSRGFWRGIAPDLKKDPHLLYLRARWYALRKDPSRLASFLIKYSDVLETTQDQWFKIRSLLIWDLVDEKQYKDAYKIAASHNYEDPSNYVDGEWFAGKIAYFNLRNPKLAYEHFKNILDYSKYSISRAKGAYWSGVVATELGFAKESGEYFKVASKYIDTFYGQLALMKLKNSHKVSYTLPDHPKITHSDIAWFKNNDLLIISHIFSYAHKDSPTRKFIRAALESADTAGKKYLIAKFGKHVGIDLLSTISGKEVARGGDLFIEHSYPVLKLGQDNMATDRALVHSIVRQESEFNAKAKSSAGASGLMQLMYPTAKEVGRKLNHRVTNTSLNNPKMNIVLGSNYLSQLLNKYNGSYVLAIVAYNAGGGNVDKWIKKSGDPRKFKNIDRVVEWIEKIPFSETRGYVQYVLSNLQIYRNLLRNKENSMLRKVNLDLGKDLLL